jgi:hypothetical protein
MDGDLTRVWQEIGQLQGGQSAQEARSGRIEDSIKNLSDETNRRFDGVKLHLDEQDKDIKQILINTAKHEGGEEQKKSAAETKNSAWNRWGMAATIAAPAMVMGGLVARGLWAAAQYFITYHTH